MATPELRRSTCGTRALGVRFKTVESSACAELFPACQRPCTEYPGRTKPQLPHLVATYTTYSDIFGTAVAKRLEGRIMPNLSRTTKDHDEIRRWAEERGGTPSHVKRTGSGEDIGILRIDFPGYSGEESLEPISWDQFFEKFDERNLSLIYQEETAGGQKSNFNKLVSAETAESAEKGRRSGRSNRGRSASSRPGARSRAKKSAGARSGSASRSSNSHSAKKAGGGRKTASASLKRSAGTAKKAAKTSSKTSAKRAASRGGASRSTARKSAAARGGAKKTAQKKVAGKKTGARKTASKKTASRRRR